MANITPDVVKENIPGCSVDEDSYLALIEQAYNPRNIDNPGDPVLTFTGNGALTQSVILDRWAKPNSYEWAFRTRVTQPAGTGWGWINIPSAPAGFHIRPIIKVDGTYRAQSIAIQEDGSGNTNNQSTEGAGPRGPFMGQEAHHWSSTQRIYIGYFRRDNPLDMFIEFRVEYVCS